MASFIGEDASGSFGILGGHARMMTILQLGLARFRIANGDQRYLATSGGVLYFRDDELTVCARRIFVGDDIETIGNLLQKKLLREEQQLDELKGHLRRIEEQMLRRLTQLQRQYD